MEKVRQFLEEAERTCIVFDYDVDGICAAAIIKVVLEALNKKPCGILASSKPPVINGKLDNLIESRDPKEIIFLDIEVSQYEDLILSLSKGGDRKILVLDHHPPKKKLKDGVIHINSHFLDKGYYPTARMAYDVAKDFEIEGVSWIAAVGVIADAGGKVNKDFIEKVLEDYGLEKGEDENYFDSELGEVSHILNSYRIAKPTSKTPTLVRRLSRMRSPVTIRNDWQLLKTHRKVQGYIDNQLKLSEDCIEGDGLFMKLNDPKYAVRSTLASILSHRYSDKNVVIAQIRSSSDQVHLSLRSQKTDLRKLTEEAEGLYLKGGGHKNSVGIVVKKENFERLWKYLKEKLK